MLNDLRSGVSVPVISARFHNSIVEVSLALCQDVRNSSGSQAVALSGGVWQNRFLLERAVLRLREAGFETLVHRRTPPNDGSIALGQAVIAAQILVR
jgi:hydrogenase maturation protein HypF